MGMCASLEQVTPQQLKQLIAHTEKMTQILETIEKMRKKTAKAGTSAEARRTLKKSARDAYSKCQQAIEELPFGALPTDESERSRKQFRLEKDWHVLHYAMNGTAKAAKGPLGQAVLGGKGITALIGIMSTGPLRYLEPKEVKAIAKALAKIDPDQLLPKLDTEDAEAKHIYLAETLEDLSGWSYFPKFFRQFRSFYTDAARNGNAMLLSIT
jgi:hypothetical protein